MIPENITGVIFAAGKGSRMGCDSKAMVELNNRPLISYGIQALIDYGIKNIVIFYRSNDYKILEIKNMYRNCNIKLTFIEDKQGKGIHNCFIEHEHSLKFPLISLDCDIFFLSTNFSKMVNNIIKYYENGNYYDAAVLTSKINRFDEPKCIVINNDIVTDYISEGDEGAIYGGFVFLWMKSPCEIIRKFYAKKNRSESFLSYYSKHSKMIKMEIDDIWDIDDPERLIESEKLILTYKNLYNGYDDFALFTQFLMSQPEFVSIALGGSRSLNTHKNNSDYDLFCLVSVDNFEKFKEEFADKISKLPYVIISVYAFYLEYWGYLYKIKTVSGTQFDVSILPVERKSEMTIRKSNKTIYDPYKIFEIEKTKAKDENWSTFTIESKRNKDYFGLFHFEWMRFNNACIAKDYWLALKSLERMKKYYLHLFRLKNNNYANTPHCPEKNFSTINETLNQYYIIDGTFESLKKTALLFVKLTHEL